MQLVKIPLLGVPNAGVISVGLPVQFVKLPLVGVPIAGVIKVGLVINVFVNSSVLVSCLVTPDCTMGNTSEPDVELAVGKAEIAMVVIINPSNYQRRC